MIKIFFIIFMIKPVDGKILYQDQAVCLFQIGTYSYSLLLNKTEIGQKYKLKVDKENVILYKENNIIFKKDEIKLNQKMNENKKIEKGGIYDIQGRRVKREDLNKKGIYFDLSKNGKRKKIISLK